MMMDMDFEDFMEEVKFQMTEYDILEESIIFDWEEQARSWVENHNTRHIKKNGDEITVLFDNEEICEEIAREFYKAVKNQQEERYWNHFKLVE